MALRAVINCPRALVILDPNLFVEELITAQKVTAQKIVWLYKLPPKSNT